MPGRPPGPPPSGGGGKTILIVAAVAVVLLVAAVGGVIYFSSDSGSGDVAGPEPTQGQSGPGDETPAAPADWAEDACVKPVGQAPAETPAETPAEDGTGAPDTATYQPVACSDPGATGKVLKMAGAGGGLDEPDCPEETDVDVEAGSDGRACVRNLKEPHPGDPGKGGGILRKGDCVLPPLAGRAVEVPCSRDSWYGKVSGLASSYGSCPGGTYDAIKRSSGKPKVVCLGKGGKVLGPGDCVRKVPTNKRFNVSQYKVSCGKGSAWAKVTKVVKKTSSCPYYGGRRLTISQSGSGFRKVMCLRRV